MQILPGATAASSFLLPGFLVSDIVCAQLHYKEQMGFVEG